MKVNPRYTALLLSALLASASTLTACSDDNNDTKNNATNNKQNNKTDMSPDMTEPDMAQPDMTEPDMTEGPTPDVAEIEPNNVVELPDDDEATSFEIGKSIGGFIDRSNGDDVDLDFYKTKLDAGDVLEIEIAATGAGIAEGGLIVNIFDGEDNIDRFLVGPKGSKRQVFAPVTGDYYIMVYDERAGQEPVPTHGGATATYVINTKRVELTPSDINVPSQTSGDFSDHAIDSYKLTLAEQTVLQADLIAGRDPIGSDLDPVLILWDVTKKEVVAYNDDIDAETGNYDSAIDAALESGEYIAIIDFYDNVENSSYNLGLTKGDDTYDLPGMLTIGEMATGQIDAANADTQRFDSDYFKLTLMPGQIVRIQATATGAMAPVLVVERQDEDGETRVAASLSVEDASAVTINVPSSATGPTDFIVIVNDENNVTGDAPSYVGGSTYGYELTAEMATWTPVAANLPLDQVAPLGMGDYIWYSLPLTAGQLVSLSASTNAVGISTITAIINGEGEISFGGNSGSYLAKADETIVLGLRDEFYRGTYGQTMVDLDVQINTDNLTNATYTTVAEEATNTTAATAQVLTLPALVKGVTQADDMEDPIKYDYYKVTLGAGESISIITEADPDAPLLDPNDPTSGKSDADTIIVVLDATGKELTVNDDLFNGNANGFSGLIFRAPAAGDYIIKIEPFFFDFFGSFINGNYLLKVSSESL